MRRRIWILSALVLAAAGACTGDLPAARLLAPSGGAADAAALPTPVALVDNTVPYRNTSQATAHGRSGSATVAARALLGRDNVADVEVGTGDLDLPAAEPGSIDRVQVKIFDPSNGRLASTDNYRAGGRGSWSHAYPFMVHDQRLALQVNVSGIDGQRTDVVSVGTLVKWRPDLHPSGVDAPARALIGAPVNVVVPVHELNGDVGAHADCVLYADGTAVDRSLGIWVDRGDVVTCLFRTTFHTAGVKALEARVENVVPGDYDTSNNSAFATIEIIDPVATFHGVAAASNVVTGTEQASGRAALYPRVDFLSTTEHRTVRTLIDASIAYPRLGATQVLVARESDGVTFGSTLVSLDLSGGCDVRITRGQFFSVCATGPGTYQLFWSTTQGSIAFWSLESQTQWNGTRYVYSGTGLPPDEPPQPEQWGSSLTLHVSLFADGRQFDPAPVIALTPFDAGSAIPYSCTGAVCSGSRLIEHGVRGQTVF